MTVTAAQLAVKVIADTKDAEKGLQTMGEHADKAKGFFGGLLQKGTEMAAGLGIFAATAAGVGFLKDQFFDCFTAASDAQSVMAQTNAVLTSTHQKAGMSADAIADLATSLSKVTPFEDETIQSAENMLLTFTNIGKKVFPQATETVLNMSKALGQDLNSSAIQLGKALNDPINGMTALKRVGVTFTDDQARMITKLQESGDLMGAQKIILGELQTEFGGSARAAGETFAGKLEILNTQFGNVKESIGNALLPILSDLAGKALPFVTSAMDKLPGILDIVGKFLSDNVLPPLKSLGEVAGNIVPFIEGLVNSFVDGFKSDNTDKVAVLKNLFGDLKTAASTVYDFFNTYLKPKLDELATAVGTVTGKVIELIGWFQDHQTAMTIFKDLLVGIGVACLVNAVPGIIAATVAFWGQAAAAGAAAVATLAATWPFVLLAGAIAGAIFVGKLIIDHWGDITKKAGELKDKVGMFFSNLGTSIHQKIDDLVTWFKELPGRVGTEIGKLKDGVWTKMQDVGKNIMSAISDVPGKILKFGEDLITNIGTGITNKANDLKTILMNAIKDAVNAIPGGAAAAKFFGIPGYAAGTDYAPGGMAIVGERGPELVMLPRGAQVVPHDRIQSQRQQNIIVQPAPIYLDGRLLANGLMPYITNEIRYNVGVH